MSHETELRGLIATKPTLKWFIVIGVVIIIVGIIVTWAGLFGLGIILFAIGVFLLVLSILALLYLWFSDHLLPPPRIAPVSK